MFNVLKGNQSTMVSGIAKTDSALRSDPDDQNRISMTAYDNAWLSSELLGCPPDSQRSGGMQYTGRAGVINRGLRHPLIPHDDGAGANGFVSDHCPIWFDVRVH